LLLIINSFFGKCFFSATLKISFKSNSGVKSLSSVSVTLSFFLLSLVNVDEVDAIELADELMLDISFEEFLLLVY
jgi:hypothetical protein